MTDFLDRWAAESPEHARLVAEERLITQATEAIWEEMEKAGISKTELAARMGKTKGFVSQILNGSRNMTLRTLADIGFALGRQPDIRLGASPSDGWTSDSAERMPIGRPKVRYQRTANVFTPVDHWHTAA